MAFGFPRATGSAGSAGSSPHAATLLLAPSLLAAAAPSRTSNLVTVAPAARPLPATGLPPTNLPATTLLTAGATPRFRAALATATAPLLPGLAAPAATALLRARSTAKALLTRPALLPLAAPGTFTPRTVGIAAAPFAQFLQPLANAFAHLCPACADLTGAPTLGIFPALDARLAALGALGPSL